MDGYYTNTIFHRLVPNFILQGGDPTGTGHGGVSALSDDGELFEDEFHSRLKFNRRGLLGMANEGKNSNGSQFFLTLATTPELQGTHTMFGRVEGDTIYNLMKMADVEMTEEEGSERPLYPTKITGAEILVNPFDDMVARVRVAPRTKAEDDKKSAAKKRKKPAGKNVLSFGGDEGEDGMIMPVVKKAKANPKLVSVEVEEESTKTADPTPKKPVRRRRSSTPPTPDETEPVEPARTTKAAKEAPPSPSPEPEPASRRTTQLDRTNAEIAALKASMKRNVESAPKHTEKPKSALEAMIPDNSTRGRKRGKMTDEKGAIDMFKAFKQRLDDLPPDQQRDTDPDDELPATHGASEPSSAQAQPSATENDDDEAALCDLHFIANCQSCKAWTDGNENDVAERQGDPGWMAHQLTFAKDLLGKDLEWKRKMAEIEVIDPREKARTIKEENRRRDKGGGKGKEMANGLKL